MKIISVGPVISYKPCLPTAKFPVVLIDYASRLKLYRYSSETHDPNSTCDKWKAAFLTRNVLRLRGKYEQNQQILYSSLFMYRFHNQSDFLSRN